MAIVIVLCHPLADCSNPEPSNNATFNHNSTKEGSKMMITCKEGLYLQDGGVEFLCNSNGSWTPDPAGQYCREPGMHIPFNFTKTW